VSTITKADVRKLLKRLLLPELTARGFTARKDGFGWFRVRNEFIDVISVQVGRGPDSLYLHYFVNLVANPVADSLHGYRVGHRLDRHPESGAIWVADSEEELSMIIASVWSAVEACALPFVDGITDLRDYVVEIVSDVNERPFDFDLMVALAGLGKFNKVYWMCQGALDRLPRDIEGGELGELRDATVKLRQAVEAEETGELLREWRRIRLAELGVVDAAVAI